MRDFGKNRTKCKHGVFVDVDGKRILSVCGECLGDYKIDLGIRLDKVCIDEMSELPEDFWDKYKKDPCNGCGSDHDPEDCTHGFNEPEV